MNQLRRLSFIRSRLPASALLAAAIFGLTACGGAGSRVSSPSEHARGAERSRDQVEEAVALLREGEAEAARKRLMTALERHPKYPIARKLLLQIDNDPKKLLGASSARYTVRAGETFSSIASKKLGDPMMFYALARYNGVERPSSLTAGTVILVPQRTSSATRKAPSRSEPARRSSAVANSEPGPAATQEETAPAQAGTAPARRAPNPVLASKLRATALAAMNDGAINLAVGLLRQALAADPGNSAVKADLARALRIHASVGKR